jgi:hypothetical protein
MPDVVRNAKMKLLKPLTSIILLSLTLLSCNDWSKGKFEITNNTSVIIDSLFIEPNRYIIGKYVSIKPNETISYITDMSDDHNDGLHRLEYKIGEKHTIKGLLYYSNGNSVEDLIKVGIYPDTIVVKSIYNSK